MLQFAGFPTQALMLLKVEVPQRLITLNVRVATLIQGFRLIAFYNNLRHNAVVGQNLCSLQKATIRSIKNVS
jgi:hypothetical protein